MPENYTLIVKFDDAELNKQIAKIKGAFPQAETDDKKKANDPLSQLMKLAGIAAGVTGILLLVKKIVPAIINASPNLQAVVDIMNTMVTLILRPIGDFIGVVLRPIMIALLRNFIIPWYRINGAAAIQTGIKIGERYVDLFEKLSKGDILGFLFTDVGGEDLSQGFKDWWQKNITEPLENFQFFPPIWAEEPNPATKELDGIADSFKQANDELKGAGGISFSEIIRQLRDGIIDFFTIDENDAPQIGGKAREDWAEKKGGKGNILSRAEFLQLRKTLGPSGVASYLQEHGLSVSPHTTDISGGKRPSTKSVNVTVNTDGRVNTDFERALEEKVKEVVVEHEKKWSDRYRVR